MANTILRYTNINVAREIPELMFSFPRYGLSQSMVSNSGCCTSETEVESAYWKADSDQKSLKKMMRKDQNNWGHFMAVEKTNKEIDNILRLDSRKIFPEFPEV